MLPLSSSLASLHCVDWFGWTSYRSANCTSVWSPLTAAGAILALKAAEWLRRSRLMRSASEHLIEASHQNQLGKPGAVHIRLCEGDIGCRDGTARLISWSVNT